MNRAFLEKLRNPDTDFSMHLKMLSMIIPLGMGFLFTIILVALVVIVKITSVELVGTPSPYPKVLIYSPGAIIFITYVTLQILRAYVYFKLKKKDNSQGCENS